MKLSIIVPVYFNELNLKPLYADIKEKIINVFKSSELHIKKVIMLEVLGLVYSDGFYDAEEENFIKKFWLFVHTYG